METVAHVDTHVAVWLWSGDRVRLAPIRSWIEEAELVISPIVELELQYLFEIGRITRGGAEVVRDLVGSIGVRLAATALPEVIAHALALTWTRDPFDRLIAATALAEGAPLLTRDKDILKHCGTAVWGARGRKAHRTPRK